MKEDNFLAKMLKRLRKQDPPSKDGEPAKKPTMYFYMLAVLVAGVVIMMGSELFEKQEEDSILTVAAPDESAKTEEVETFGRSNDKTDKTITDYERTFENQIKEALETITGVSDVTVVVNVDATVLAQSPKLAPHMLAMRANIAAAISAPIDAVSVKATTEEGLGFTGEKLGIAAHAVALIEEQS